MTEDEAPSMLTARCRHWWRKRIGVPVTGPIKFKDAAGREMIKMAPQVPFCRQCAGKLSDDDFVSMSDEDIARYLSEP